MVRSPAEERPWYRKADDLIDQLRTCHRAETRAPGVRGYEDLVGLQSGGQGHVFLATRSKDGRRVALKVFHADSFDSTQMLRRFEREIHLVSRLKHPNIVRLYHWGRTDDDRPFLTMEFVDGRSLAEAVEDMQVDEILELFVEITAALRHAHRRGVIHRDLKPGNIRVDSGGHVRLLDFGLAKPVDPESGSSESGSSQADELSTTGQFLGSLPWSSPEQVRGQPGDVDTLTDVYALGVLLYHCLTGRFPYAVDGSVAEVVDNILNTPPARPTRWNAAVSRDLETVLLRCLAKEPSRRYPSVDELARDLAHVLAGEPIEARRDGPLFVLGSLVRKHKLASALLLVSLVGLIAFSVVTSVLYRHARSMEQTASAALAEKRAEVEKVAAVNEYLLTSLVGPGPADVAIGDVRLVDALDAAALGIDTRADPAVRAALHVAFAYWFLSLPDRLEQAEEHALEALRLYEDQESADDSYLAWTYETNAEVLLRKGDAHTARAMFRDALERYRLIAPDDLSVARVAMRLIHCGFQLGDLSDLEPHAVASYEIVRHHRGEDDPQTIALAENLARLRQHLAETAPDP